MDTPIPDPIETVVVHHALGGVQVNGEEASVLFQTPAGRRYVFPLSPQGRKDIGTKLLAPSIVPAAGPIPPQ